MVAYLLAERKDLEGILKLGRENRKGVQHPTLPPIWLQFFSLSYLVAIIAKKYRRI
jgi:hypothetical protein